MNSSLSKPVPGEAARQARQRAEQRKEDRKKRAAQDQRDAEAAQVTRTAKFLGTRPGFVFTTGKYGTGYYPDSDDEEDADTEDDGGESDENSPDVGRL